MKMRTSCPYCAGTGFRKVKSGIRYNTKVVQGFRDCMCGKLNTHQFCDLVATVASIKKNKNRKIKK